MQGMISFNLFVRVFVITLYPTLHRLMGRNCEIISGCFTLGIRTRSVSFAPSGSKPVSRNLEQAHKEISHYVLRFLVETCMEAIVSWRFERFHIEKRCLQLFFRERSLEQLLVFS